MEPVRAVLGVRESMADVAARLRAHQASAAPAVAAGRAVGIVTRAQAEMALRYGLGHASVRDVMSGGAPRVAPGTGLETMKSAVVGTAPGLVVCDRQGALRGVITRHRLEEGVQRHLASRHQVSWRLGRDVSSRMESLLGPERAEILQRAGGLAAAQGVGLYLAGGVVRDLLLGRPSKDLDLVVEGDGGSFADELAQVLGGTVKRHDAFGTAFIDAAHSGRLDVASARRETYDAPSVLPRVSPGTVLEDLLRRDVTINSMAIRLDSGRYGRLTDEVGGERDLRARMLRVNHRMSLVEDPTRAFRMARLAGRLGFGYAEESLGSLDLARRVGAFDALTGERLLREFGLAAAEDGPATCLDQYSRLGLLDAIGCGLTWDAAKAARVTRLVTASRDGLFGESRLEGLPTRALLLLIMLSDRSSPPQRSALATRLRITGDAAERLESALVEAARLSRGLSRASRASRVVELCEAAHREVLMVAWATGPAKARKAIAQYLGRLRGVRPTIGGDALKEMGLEPGPYFAQVLSELRRARLDGRVQDAASEHRLAERLVGRLGKGKGRSRRN